MIDISDWSSPDKRNLLLYLGTNAYRSERYKMLYVATPKVACTTLKWWFADLEGYGQSLRNLKESVESDPDLVIHDTFHKVAPEVAGLDAEALIEPLTSDAYFRFALVRNPYKRLFSAWQSKLLLREPLQVAPYTNCAFYDLPIASIRDIAKAFEGFLEHLAAHEAPVYLDVHWTPQVDLLRPDLVAYTNLSKVENAKELGLLLQERVAHALPDPFATRFTNESLIPFRREFVTERSERLIQDLYAEDFRLFGYSTQLPEDVGSFSGDQVGLAVQAISMIRGRHQRIGEMTDRIQRLDQFRIEHEQLIKSLHVRVIDLDKGVAWLGSQRDAWEKTVSEREKSIAHLQDQIKELTTGNAWLAGQRDAWEGTANKQTHLIAQLQDQVQELTKGSDWLTSQQEAWGSVVTERDKAIGLLKIKIEELVKERANLASQRDALEKTAGEREQLIKDMASRFAEVRERLAANETRLKMIEDQWVVRVWNFLFNRIR